MFPNVSAWQTDSYKVWLQHIVAHSVTNRHCDSYTVWQIQCVSITLSDSYTVWQLHSVTANQFDSYTLWQLHSVSAS